MSRNQHATPDCQDIVIVGAGPAGLTAALYALRTARKTVLLEQTAVGGQALTTWKIDNYPGLPHINGAEFMLKLEAQVQELGLNLVLASVQGIVPGNPHRLITSNGEILSKAVILAMGAKPRVLGIPGEETFRGRGVSYCATCDAAFFKNLPVAVVGGGNTALEEAEFLTRFASKIYLIHRREQFRADKIIQDQIRQHPNIELAMPYVPKEILGDSQGVTALRVAHATSGQVRDLMVKGVFIFAGWTPQTAEFKQTLKSDDQGYLVTDQNLMTDHPGIYAAGDCRANQVKQIVVAAGEGALAAVLADRYLYGLECK